MSAVLDQPKEAANEPTGEVHVAVTITPEMRRVVTTMGAFDLARSYEVDCPEIAQSLADERKGWAKAIDMIDAMKKDVLAPLKKAVKDTEERLDAWLGAKRADLQDARELAGQKLLTWDAQEKARLAREQAERDALARKVRQEADARDRATARLVADHGAGTHRAGVGRTHAACSCYVPFSHQRPPVTVGVRAAECSRTRAARSLFLMRTTSGSRDMPR